MLIDVVNNVTCFTFISLSLSGHYTSVCYLYFTENMWVAKSLFLYRKIFSRKQTPFNKKLIIQII